MINPQLCLIGLGAALASFEHHRKIPSLFGGILKLDARRIERILRSIDFEGLPITFDAAMMILKCNRMSTSLFKKGGMYEGI